MLLNILHTGGLFETVTGIFLLLQGIFWYQIVKGGKSGTWVNDGSGGSISSSKNKKWYQNNFFKWFSVPLAIAYIIFIIVVASDYKGV